jgi:hypothetical protein
MCPCKCVERGRTVEIDNRTYRSPNYDSRPGGIEGICLHTTEGNFPHDANWLCNPQSRVSAHYVIDRGGGIYQLVDDDKRAWHAGHTWGNNHTIGIEISHIAGQDYPSEQEQALAMLCVKLIQRYNIPHTGIVAHRWLTPARKSDPTDMTDEYLNTWIATLYAFQGNDIPMQDGGYRPDDGWYRCKYPATVRTAPGVSEGAIVATFAIDSYVLVTWVEGAYVRGSGWWAHLTESQMGFIHASALEQVGGGE